MILLMYATSFLWIELEKLLQGKPRNRIIATSKRLASYRRIYPRQDPTEDKRNKKRFNFRILLRKKAKKGEEERKSTQQFSLEM